MVGLEIAEPPGWFKGILRDENTRKSLNRTQIYGNMIFEGQRKYYPDFSCRCDEKTWSLARSD